MLTTLKTDYPVDTGAVVLTIKIGEGQLGTSVVRLGETQLDIGEIDVLEIGQGPDLAGQVLFIKTVVADVNDNTNHTSVSYELQGGKADKVFNLDGTADEEGGSVVYRASFSLKS